MQCKRLTIIYWTSHNLVLNKGSRWIKEAMPNSVTYLNWPPKFVWYVVWYVQQQIPKIHVLRRHWTACSEYENHPRFNSQYNWGDLYNHSMSTIIFTLMMNKIFLWILKSTRKWLRPQFGFANHVVLIVCVLSQEKWASWEKVTF